MSVGNEPPNPADDAPDLWDPAPGIRLHTLPMDEVEGDEPVGIRQRGRAAPDRQTQDGYKVGYKKPPLHSRAQPGQPSKNPKGRPKGIPNPLPLARFMDKKITQKCADGRYIEMTRLEALDRTIVDAAARGKRQMRKLADDLVERDAQCKIATQKHQSKQGKLRHSKIHPCQLEMAIEKCLRPRLAPMLNLLYALDRMGAITFVGERIFSTQWVGELDRPPIKREA